MLSSRATKHISFGTGFTEAMIHNGVAAMELMGDWDIGFIQGYYPGWVATGDMGIGFFPTVPGGKGNPADLEGNTTSYARVGCAHLARRDLRRGEVRRPSCAPPRLTRSSRSAKALYRSSPARKSLFASSPLKQYLVPIYDAVQKAPYFQYSWDQALGATRATPMLHQPRERLRPHRNA